MLNFCKRVQTKTIEHFSDRAVANFSGGTGCFSRAAKTIQNNCFQSFFYNISAVEVARVSLFSVWFCVPLRIELTRAVRSPTQSSCGLPGFRLKHTCQKATKITKPPSLCHKGQSLSKFPGVFVSTIFPIMSMLAALAHVAWIPGTRAELFITRSGAECLRILPSQRVNTLSAHLLPKLFQT